jgi:hypothetical protein
LRSMMFGTNEPIQRGTMVHQAYLKGVANDEPGQTHAKR